jgi:hypothetical protein
MIIWKTGKVHIEKVTMKETRRHGFRWQTGRKEPRDSDRTKTLAEPCYLWNSQTSGRTSGLLLASGVAGNAWITDTAL